MPGGRGRGEEELKKKCDHFPGRTLFPRFLHILRNDEEKFHVQNWETTFQGNNNCLRLALQLHNLDNKNFLKVLL